MQRLIIAGVALTLIIAIFLPVYGATEPMRQEAARERLQEEARVRGGETYGAHCVSCHGADGEGTIGPAVNNLPHEAAALESVIAGGVAGTAMPAFAKAQGGALGPHQITDLALFLSHWDASLVSSDEPHDAPETPSGDAAQATFEQKCGACHSIGGGRGVGPDLKDVTARRDRDWLIQFIISPEQLIAQDAAAQQLVAEYNGLVMPDSGLSESGAAAVLAYIDRASDPADTAAPTTPDATPDATPAVEAVPIGTVVTHTLLATGEPGDNEYPSGTPGTTEILPREYPGAPPLVPHSLVEFEITPDTNACLSCHTDGISLGEGHTATKIPSSHYTDVPTGILSDRLHEMRYNCRLCHLPQSAEAPLVK